MIKRLFIFSIACFCLLSFSNRISFTDNRDKNLPVRAVSLAGWLCIEGWVKPSLFDGIPNNDFLDGSRLQFKSVTMKKYLNADYRRGTIILSNKTAPSYDESFKLWRINETTFNFRVSYNKFVGLNGSQVVAVAKTPSRAETFEIHRNPKDLRRARIKAPNGFFLQVKTDGLVTADYEGNGGWGDDNPSVFKLNIMVDMRGEYQLTNGYGPLAQQVMKEHWSTFIVEKDFQFIKNNGLNAVKIPVGWWIAYDPNPPKPYVGGSLQALDNAFSWAEKIGLKVIIDLHAAPGSQNGWPHSGSRDGSLEWGRTDESIQQTVHVIDFLTARYAKSPSLFAVVLLNEPFSPGVSLDALTKYYKAGYNAVRKHSSTAYVILANRLTFFPRNPKELLSLTNGLNRVVIVEHYYNLFSTMFDNLTAQENIDYVYNFRSAELRDITSSNGPLTFVGEWTCEWHARNATKEDLRRFANAQLQVYNKHATFGWAFWTLKSVYNHWSLEWLINNGYFKL